MNNAGYSSSGRLEYVLLPQIKHVLVPEELIITRNAVCSLPLELTRIDPAVFYKLLKTFARGSMVTQTELSKEQELPRSVAAGSV